MPLNTTARTADSSVSAPTRAQPVWLVGAVAAIVAAAATVLVAVVAKAFDVPMEVDGEEIPTLGFGMLTLIWSVVGTLLAMALARWANRPARIFVAITVALTLFSFVPVATADATTATQVSLAISHVIAAAIVIPALALRLAKQG